MFSRQVRDIYTVLNASLLQDQVVARVTSEDIYAAALTYLDQMRRKYREQHGIIAVRKQSRSCRPHSRKPRSGSNKENMTMSPGGASN